MRHKTQLYKVEVVSLSQFTIIFIVSLLSPSFLSLATSFCFNLRQVYSLTLSSLVLVAHLLWCLLIIHGFPDPFLLQLLHFSEGLVRLLERGVSETSLDIRRSAHETRLRETTTSWNSVMLCLYLSPERPVHQRVLFSVLAQRAQVVINTNRWPFRSISVQNTLVWWGFARHEGARGESLVVDLAEQAGHEGVCLGVVAVIRNFHLDFLLGLLLSFA